MRIGIDARFYGPNSKGLGRYTQQLVINLETYDQKNEYVIFLRKETSDLYIPKNKNFHKVVADFRWYSFAEQFLFPLLLLKERCDVVHFPHFNVPILYRRKFIVTIHDLILLRYPTVRATTLNPLFYKIKFIAYKLVIRSAIKRSRYICAVSDFTRKDILRQYPDTDPHKVIVTYEAACDVPRISSEKSSAIMSRYGIMKPYILYAGNAYPHKNLERLLQAYIASDVVHTHDLILVGKDDFFYKRLMQGSVHMHGGTHVHMLPSVSDTALHVLYNHATAYIFPSLYEGFGLPPLEAMLHNCPVASSDATCLPEIVGDAALLFDAKDAAAITHSINKIVTDENLRKTLIQKGQRHVLKYSWLRMAQETLAVYEDTLS